MDGPEGYRNDHGKPRRLSIMACTIELRRPRVRELEQRFESRILPVPGQNFVHVTKFGEYDTATRDARVADEDPARAAFIA